MASASVVKYLLVLINALHLVLGLLIVTFGFWLEQASPVKEILAVDSTSLTVIRFTMAVGFILVIVGACGALGNVFQDRLVLGIFLGISAVVLILEISLLAYGFSQKNSFQAQIQSTWNSAPNNVKFILQSRFNCCGYIDSTEWNGIYDTSCYSNINSTTVWPSGCSTQLSSWLDQNSIILGIIVGGVLAVSFGQVVFSGHLLWKKLRRTNEVGDDDAMMLEGEKRREDIYREERSMINTKGNR